MERPSKGLENGEIAPHSHSVGVKTIKFFNAFCAPKYSDFECLYMYKCAVFDPS